MKELMTRIINKIPYFSQWETPEMVEKILELNTAEIDLNWRSSGAKSKSEYELWSWNVCGMACLKMIIASMTGKKYKTIELAKKCELYGGYKPDGKSIDGLFYEPFVRFIKAEFGIDAKIFRRFLTIRKIKAELEKGNYFMVSVSRHVRNPEMNPEGKGGHLVLMTGYDNGTQSLFLHNPSGIYKKSQENFEISEKDFKKFFAGRGILILK